MRHNSPQMCSMSRKVSKGFNVLEKFTESICEECLQPAFSTQEEDRLETAKVRFNHTQMIEDTPQRTIISRKSSVKDKESIITRNFNNYTVDQITMKEMQLNRSRAQTHYKQNRCRNNRFMSFGSTKIKMDDMRNLQKYVKFNVKGMLNLLITLDLKFRLQKPKTAYSFPKASSISPKMTPQATYFKTMVPF